MDWIKLWTEARTDGKLRTLSDAQHRVWFNLLCIAGEQHPPGTIPVHDSDWELLSIEVSNGDTDLLQQTIQRITRLRIVRVDTNADGEPLVIFVNWPKRQARRPSDEPEAAAERKRLQRQREREARDAQQSRNVTRDCHTEESREEENREEGEGEEETDCARGPEAYRDVTCDEAPRSPLSRKPPSLEQVTAYATAYGRPELAEEYFDRYQARDWVTPGRHPIPVADYQAEFRTFVRVKDRFRAEDAATAAQRSGAAQKPTGARAAIDRAKARNANRETSN